MSSVSMASHTTTKFSSNGGSNGYKDAPVVYDPEIIHQGVNLSDPEELEAHIQVLDVRERLRARRRRAIRLFSVAFCIVMVALMAGLGLVTRRGESNVTAAAGSTQSPISTSLPPSSSTGSLPLPPADLASKCSATALQSQQGFLVCEGACEVADCCTIPEEFALSCSKGNENACQQYLQYCSILQTTPAVSPISDEEIRSSIDEACIGLDPSSLIDSDCVALCRKGFCCFDDDTVGCEPNCQTYFNCAAAFQSQQQQQQQATSTTTNPISNPINQEDSVLKQQIDAICGTAIETVSPPGENSCESICAPAYCCFDHLCVPTSDVDCQDYSACYVLYADVNDVKEDITTANLGDEVHEACAGLLDIDEAISNEACNAICSPGACCFEEKMSCSNVDCAMYAECIVLHPNFIPVSKAEVTDACRNHNDANLQSEEPTLCEQLCSLHVMQCCFHLGGDCDDAVLLGDNSVYCDRYQACAVLGTDGSSLIQSHKDELEAACTGGTSTRSQCIQLCSSATCCYSSSVEESCAHVDASVTCSDYEACDVLYG
ncbi:hypothetical protein IV203_031748 [Nitzschia inconspicua]|uniref:Uncharacterized protein n=1 Tax=Nitzschia inconspicua TaxID=303405 RepID=A0A9K3LUW7_9STRA|nr:hypothetical protein IV203_031748 [Nitzschia inconspicua]